MKDEDRREFLKKLAKSAVYTAPVVYSLAAPIELVGQGMSSQKKPKAPAQQPAATDAPWDRPPPGQEP